MKQGQTHGLTRPGSNLYESTSRKCSATTFANVRLRLPPKITILNNGKDHPILTLVNKANPFFYTPRNSTTLHRLLTVLFLMGAITQGLPGAGGLAKLIFNRKVMTAIAASIGIDIAKDRWLSADQDDMMD